MIKLRNYIWIALSIFFASCAADIEIESMPITTQMVEVDIVANNSDDTRVYLDGNRTEWQVGDAITLALTATTTEFYTFTIDCEDDKGNKVSGKFRGTGEFIDW